MLKHIFSGAALAAALFAGGSAWAGTPLGTPPAARDGAPHLTVLAADHNTGSMTGGAHAASHGNKSQYNAGQLVVETPWARASLGKAANGAAYFSVRNTGKEADRLIGVASPVAAKAAIHNHVNDNGIMRMRPVKDVTVPAGGTAVLKPGGYHVMLMGLHAPLKDGTTFPLTLEFAKAGKVEVRVRVRKMTMQGGAPMRH